MMFLLDKTYAVEKLLETMPRESASLAYYLVGERHLKAGHPDEAVKAYEESLVQQGGAGLSRAVGARLKQLRAGQSSTDASEVQP